MRLAATQSLPKHSVQFLSSRVKDASLYEFEKNVTVVKWLEKWPRWPYGLDREMLLAGQCGTQRVILRK